MKQLQHLHRSAPKGLDMHGNGWLLCCIQAANDMQLLRLHARLILPYLEQHKVLCSKQASTGAGGECAADGTA